MGIRDQSLIVRQVPIEGPYTSTPETVQFGRIIPFGFDDFPWILQSSRVVAIHHRRVQMKNVRVTESDRKTVLPP